MCLAIPAEVIAITNDKQTATVSFEGVRKDISLALLSDVEPGDFVLIHVGYALNKISPDEAARTLALMTELEEAQR